MKTIALLCSGFDLMGIGAIAAGFTPIWSLEINPKLAEVAAANLKHKIYVESILDFDWSKAERPAHLHISPPCQNASIANAKGGETDLDMAIAAACCEALEIYQPDSFTLENVRGYQKFKAFQSIIDKLWGLGYWANVEVLNAADFGVPQTRDRVIVRAIKGGFPMPLLFNKKRMGWYEAIADLIPTLPESSFAEWQLKLMPGVYKDCVIDVQNVGRIPTVRQSIEPSFTMTAGCFRRKSSVPKVFLANGSANNSRDVTVVDSETPSFTITASQSKGLLRSWLECGKVVSLTPRAIARLQTLSDWYKLPENNALAGTGIGNGVPCLMAQRILESVCF
jgi:DNA (cytosine-5)-methyltransferase 1